MAITRTQIARQLYRIGGVGGRAEEGSVERPGGNEGGRNPMAQFRKIQPGIDGPNTEGLTFMDEARKKVNPFGILTELPGTAGFLARALTPNRFGFNSQRINSSVEGDDSTNLPTWAKLGFNSEAEYLASLQEQNNMDQETEVAEEDFSLKRRFAADGGRIGLRFGSEGYQGGATTQGGAGRGTDVGRSGGEGNRDRRRVEQYTKPPTTVGGSGDQKTSDTPLKFKKDIPDNFAKKLEIKDFINLDLIDDEQENMQVADVSASDINRLLGTNLYGKQKYAPNQDVDLIRMSESTLNPTITDSEIKGVLEGTITGPTGKFLKKDGGRIGAMDGGVMGGLADGNFDFENARQMYGLGKLVKKVTRSVKKIAKSPIGKAALLYVGGAGLGALGTGTGFTGFKAGLMSPTTLFKNLNTSFFGLPSGRDIVAPTKGFFGKGGEFALGEGKLGIGSLITGASAIAGALTPEQEEEAQNIADETGIDIAEIRANPNQYLGRRFRAEGGSMKEPVAKKTMPLLDMDGQEMDLRAEGGFVPIGRMEKADDVPARLSKNEFVFTADAVRNAGEGDVDKGAEVMYNMMKNLESGGEVSEESQGLDGARKMFQTSQRLEEVL